MPTNIFDMQDTWNNVSTLFNAIKMNVNNAASAVGSKLFDLQTNGTSRFSVDPDGIAVATTPALGDSSTKVATTAFVQGAIGGITGFLPVDNPHATGTLTVSTVGGNDINLNATGPGGGSAVIGSSGVDANVHILYATKNNGFHQFITNGAAQVTISGPAGALRQVALSGSVAGNPIISAAGGGVITIPDLAMTGTPVAPTQPTNDNSGLVATTAFVKSCLAAFQPLDADLTAISALGGTNTIYYRSGASVWSPVVIGANLTFAGGTLAAAGGGVADAEYVTAVAHAGLSAERVLTNTATITWDFATPGQAKANAAAGGGNVSSSGTPTVNQYGKWVTATTIQGVAPSTVLTDIGAVAKAGDTMTGGLTISGSTIPTLTLAPTSGSTTNAIVRQNGDTLVLGSAGFQFDLAASSFKTPVNIRQSVDAAGYGFVVTGNAVATAGWIWEGAAADGYDTCFGSSNGGYTFCVVGTPADFLVRFRAAGSEIKTPCAFTVSPTVPTPTAGDNSTKVATTAFVRNKEAFSAVRAGGADLSCPNGANTPLLFDSTSFNVGGKYNTANGRYTPSAGLVMMSAGGRFSNLTASSPLTLMIRKNGADFKGVAGVSIGTIGWADLTVIDNASGTDFYDVYAFCTAAASGTMSGVPQASFFQGSQL